MPTDPTEDRDRPLYAAIIMMLAAGVVVGASLAGRAVFSNVSRPATEKKRIEAMPAPKPLPKDDATENAKKEPSSEETAPANGDDAMTSFVDASVKNALANAGSADAAMPRKEDVAALKAATADPAVQAAVGGALKESATQSEPLLRRAWDAIWDVLTSFIKVKVTMNPEPPAP